MTSFLQLAAPRGLIEGLPPLHPSAALTGHDSHQSSYLKWGSECRPKKRGKITCTPPCGKPVNIP